MQVKEQQMTDTRVIQVLSAVRPTSQDKLELQRLVFSLVPSISYTKSIEIVQDACEVAYVPSREFSMDLTLAQVLHKAHDDAQIDRIMAVRNLIKQKVGA